MSLPRNEEEKLRQINKLVNQFASSIKHKPFVNDIDKARTLGFIAALRNVITQHGSKPIKQRTKDYIAKPWEEPTPEVKALSLMAIQRIKEQLKKGDTNELDGQD